RCLVLADGFYEWKPEGARKQPYRFLLKSGEPFALAGIWQEDRDGRPAFTIITTEPNVIVSEIHNRMPAMLPLHHERDWLDPDREPEQLLPLLVPFPPQRMRLYAVSTMVNSARNNSPEIIKPSSLK